jgi:hypothetical protein
MIMVHLRGSQPLTQVGEGLRSEVEIADASLSGADRIGPVSGDG